MRSLARRTIRWSIATTRGETAVASRCVAVELPLLIARPHPHPPACTPCSICSTDSATCERIIAWGGYVGLTAIIFAETGLLVGFFLPGDSLLVTAGLLAATSGVFNVYLLGLLLTVASIVGNTVGLRHRQDGRPAAVHP